MYKLLDTKVFLFIVVYYYTELDFEILSFLLLKFCYLLLLDIKMNEFKKPLKNPSRPAKAPGAPPESALSKACGAGDLEAIKLILNTVPTSHAAKIDAIFAAGLLNRFEALKYLLLLFKEKNPARGTQGKTLLHEAASLGCLQTSY